MCPFCGSGSYTFFEAINAHNYRMAFVECMDCNAQGPTGRNKDEALKRWLKRSKENFYGTNWWVPRRNA